MEEPEIVEDGLGNEPQRVEGPVPSEATSRVEGAVRSDDREKRSL